MLSLTKNFSGERIWLSPPCQEAATQNPCLCSDVYSSVSKGGDSDSSGVEEPSREEERKPEAHVSCSLRLPLASQITQNFSLEFSFELLCDCDPG